MTKKLNGWALGESAFNWILDTIPKGSKILELGSGFGSWEVAKQGYDYTCVEHDTDWLERFEKLNYIHASLDPETGWYMIEKPLPAFDLLIIDAPPAGKGSRLGILDNLHLFNFESQPILVDDIHRPNDLTLALELGHKLERRVDRYRDKNKAFAVLTVN